MAKNRNTFTKHLKQEDWVAAEGAIQADGASGKKESGFLLLTRQKGSEQAPWSRNGGN